MFGLDLISLVQLLGYPGLFIVIFLESGIFFGFFLPGATLLFIAGVLASLGIFDIRIVVPLLFTAAVLGDNAGYWFGSYVGHAMYKRPDSRFFKQEHVRLAHDFFERYGKAAVLLARFVPIARTFVPILAGVGEMRYKIFFFYNVLGAVMWACGVTLLGYFIGRHIPDAEHYLTPILAVIIAITTLPLIFTWWRKWKKEQAGAGDERAGAQRPRAIIFDLDNTLSRPIEPLSLRTASGLSKLLIDTRVAIMSGASVERMQRDVVSTLPKDTRFENLYLFPDTGARCYVYKNGAWKEAYSHIFPPGESQRVANVLKEGLRETGIVEGAPQYGERVLERDAQVTLAALGLEAPAELKAAWDPDRAKRKKLKAYLDPRLPDYDVRISSRTAIDITRKGVDKAGGVQWLAKELGVRTRELLFVGDDLKPGGNDAMVIPTGIQTRQTSGPDETAKIIEEFSEKNSP